MTTHPKERLRGGLAPAVEAHLERLALLFSRRSGGVSSPEAENVAREICATHPDLAPACWKLLDIWQDDGAADPLDALANYRAAGEQEAVLLAQSPEERFRTVASTPAYQHRGLALRVLVTDERLWHERPEATLETSGLAVQIAEAAVRRQGGYLRVVGGPRSSGRGLPELGTAVRAYGRYLNALRIRGCFADVRQHVSRLDEMTRQPIGKDLTEARWLLGTALFELEEWEWADDALREAIREYWRLGMRFEAKRARITRVMLARAGGAPPSRYLCMARRVFKAFTTEDILREPSLFAGYRMNLPLYMLEAGELDEAEELWKATPIFEQDGLETRRVGLGAIIGFAKGETESAEKTFRQTAQRFEDLEMPYDAGFCLFYLSDLLIATGRLHEGQKTLERALGFFERCELNRHVQDSLSRLRAAMYMKTGLRAALKQVIEGASGIIRRRREVN